MATNTISKLQDWLLRRLNLKAPSFVYETLNPELHEFRLLRLLPTTDFSSPIQCELFRSSLDNPPSYEALSYAWGDPTDTVTIQLKGSGSSSRQFFPHQVTNSLALALRYLRLPDETRIVWADALCINQQNIDEKNHQVRQMRNIYLQVSRVVVWLGEHDYEQTEQFLFEPKDRIEVFSKFTQTSYQTFMNKIFFMGWWTRLWIVQEVMHRRPTTAYIGSYQHDFNDLCERIHTYVTAKRVLFERDIGFHSPPKNEYSSATIASYIRRLHHIHQASQVSSALLLFREDCATLSEWTMHLISGLTWFRPQECTDDRDKIFAILGMVSEREKDHIIVDYSLTKRDVYTTAMKQILALRIQSPLLFIQSPDRSITSSGLPSWVPDWTTQQDYFSKSVFDENLCCYDMDYPGSYRIAPLPSKELLIASGIHIGVVQNVSWVELGLRAEFLRTRYTRMKVFTYIRDKSGKVSSQAATTEIDETNTLDPIEAMLTRSWGPPKTEPGDTIIISPLSAIPLIIRRASTFSYLLVGGCFLVDSKLERSENSKARILEDPGFSSIMRGSAWDESLLQDYLIE